MVKPIKECLSLILRRLTSSLIEIMPEKAKFKTSTWREIPSYIRAQNTVSVHSNICLKYKGRIVLKVSIYSKKIQRYYMMAAAAKQRQTFTVIHAFARNITYSENVWSTEPWNLKKWFICIYMYIIYLQPKISLFIEFKNAIPNSSFMRITGLCNESKVRLRIWAWYN